MICTYSRSALAESGSGHALPLRARLRHERSTPRRRNWPDSKKQEIAEKGGYSWVADIRARIRVARSVTKL